MKLSNFAKYAFCVSAIPTVYYNFFPGKIVLISIICCYPLIIYIFDFFVELFNKRKLTILDDLTFFKIFFYYGFFTLLRGFLKANNTYDWGTLLGAGVPIYIYLPFTLIFGLYTKSIFAILKSGLFFIFPFSLLIFLSSTPDEGVWSFAHANNFIYILIILAPYLKKRTNIIIIIITTISLISDIGNRSNLLNIVAGYLLVLTYYFKDNIGVKSFLNSIRVSLFWLPILFFLLAIFNVFNVFQIGNYFEQYIIENNAGKQQDLLIDSRTAIYQDVFDQISSDNKYLIGLGFLGKTKTSLTNNDSYNSEFFQRIYKNGREQTESGILNYIQWGGALGAIFYFLLLYNASFLSAFNSKNWFSIMMSVWIAFKFTFSFIEDTVFFSPFSIINFMAIGICLSSEIRNLSDSGIKSWINKII